MSGMSNFYSEHYNKIYTNQYSKLVKKIQNQFESQISEFSRQYSMLLKGFYLEESESGRISMQIYYTQKPIIKYGLKVDFYFSTNDRDGEHLHYTYTIKTQEQFNALVNHTQFNIQNNIQNIFNIFQNYENRLQKKRETRMSKLATFIKSLSLS